MSTHRIHSTFLFPTLTKSRQLLLHFRFVAQSFISSLSGYIFDTAIGGNFDIFLARLSSFTSLPSDISISGLDPTVGGHPDVHNISGFLDVFEVARCHTALLDDILSACLLRSGQRVVDDLLRQAMDIVLELTIVIGELHRGRMEEFIHVFYVFLFWTVFFPGLCWSARQRLSRVWLKRVPRDRYRSHPCRLI